MMVKLWVMMVKNRLSTAVPARTIAGSLAMGPWPAPARSGSVPVPPGPWRNGLKRWQES